MESAVKSRAIHRVGFGMSERFDASDARLFPIESGDSADSVAALQRRSGFVSREQSRGVCASNDFVSDNFATHPFAVKTTANSACALSC